MVNELCRLLFVGRTICHKMRKVRKLVLPMALCIASCGNSNEAAVGAQNSASKATGNVTASIRSTPAATDLTTSTKAVTQLTTTSAPVAIATRSGVFATPTLGFKTTDGWSYKITIPPITGVSLTVRKEIRISPPGQAKLFYSASFGNLQRVAAIGDTPGRNAPPFSTTEPRVVRVATGKIPEVMDDNGYIGGRMGPGDCSILREANDRAAKLSGAYCSKAGVDMQSNDAPESDVDAVISAFAGSRLAVTFLLPTGGYVEEACTIALLEDGTYSTVGKACPAR
jgi:hypothetical protein